MKIKTNCIVRYQLNSFKDGVITEIYGYIPMFKFDYELKLMDDLNKLGITNVFDHKEIELTPIEVTAYWWVRTIRAKVYEVEDNRPLNKDERMFAKLFSIKMIKLL